MKNPYTIFRSSLLFVVFVLVTFTLSAQPLLLKVLGNEKDGFTVGVDHRGQLLLTNTEEFSLQLFNLDLSTTADLPGWKGKLWEGNENRITLKRDSYIPEFDANLSVKVTYEVVNPGIVKKTVELFQPSMPGMYYILQQTSRPAEKPQRYVSFEYDNFPGGFVHEIYPAAGFYNPKKRCCRISDRCRL